MSDADSVGIELSKLSTLESEELDLHLEPVERWVWNGEWLGEYIGLHFVPYPVVCQSMDVDARGARERDEPGWSILPSPAPPLVAILVEPVSIAVTCHMACIASSFALGGSLISSSAKYSHHPTVDATLGCISKGLGSMPEQPSCDCIESQL